VTSQSKAIVRITAIQYHRLMGMHAIYVANGLFWNTSITMFCIPAAAVGRMGNED
jgi:hypothetical protein